MLHRIESEEAVVEVGEALQAWDEGAWCQAALSIALRAKDEARREAAERVLVATGLAPGHGGPDDMDLAIAAQAAASLQTAAAAVGEGAAWDRLPDDLLIAQGEASAQGASGFVTFVLPGLDGLADRLASPEAAMLDVGTGVGALAAAYAAKFPQLRVTGIDVSERVLEIGRSRLRDSQVASRVELRMQNVDTVNDDEAFDLAWLPAPFVPEPALRSGLPRVWAALRPGGWVMIGHGRGSGSALQAALTRFKTLAYGGTPLLENEAMSLLTSLGFESVRTLPTPPGAPGITVGRRPPHPTTQ